MGPPEMVSCIRNALCIGSGLAGRWEDRMCPVIWGGWNVSAAAGVEAPRTFRSDVPARLDRLPWSRWHWMVVAALGITWIIDGLEVTMIASFSAVLQEPESLHFSGTQIGLLNSSYLAGAVIGALVFGYLTDRLGRKKLFTVTLG